MKATGAGEEKKEFTLQTVERALSFLECVASADRPHSVKSVAEVLGLNLTTCYHLLRTLTSRGYIERHADGTLTLGSSVGVLFHSYQRSFDVSEGLREVVKDIERQTAESAFLSTLDGKSVILKYLAEGSQQLRVGGLNVGMAGNELRRASGKAVLAHLEEPLRSEIIGRNLASLPEAEREARAADVVRTLDETRARGWSMDDEESETGITGIAAPVFDSSGRIHGAVGLVAPTSRLGRTQAKAVEVVRAAGADATTILRGLRR
jgi:IclR family transcriptional regulator, acetate operon repressor